MLLRNFYVLLGNVMRNSGGSSDTNTQFRVYNGNYRNESIDTAYTVAFQSIFKDINIMKASSNTTPTVFSDYVVSNSIASITFSNIQTRYAIDADGAYFIITATMSSSADNTVTKIGVGKSSGGAVDTYWLIEDLEEPIVLNNGDSTDITLKIKIS